jgi:hypothetical protein
MIYGIFKKKTHKNPPFSFLIGTEHKGFSKPLINPIHKIFRKLAKSLEKRSHKKFPPKKKKTNFRSGKSKIFRKYRK